MNKIVFHGSNNGMIKKFAPIESTQHGKYVYATENFEIAGIFGFKMSSIARTLMFDNFGNLIVCERIKDYMKNNDCPVFIYAMDGKNFEYFDKDNWGNHEVRTTQRVKPKKIIKFDSAVEMLKQFANEGKIKLYFYPEKPEFLPKNDYDLIQNAASIYAMNKKNIDSLDELLLVHPNFKNAIEVIKDTIDSLPENKKRDYVKSIYNFKTQKLLPNIENLIDEEKDIT